MLYRLREFAIDDAFIHRRIAAHLLHTGYGFFNAHERVMVTSSPLWTILLAGLIATGHVDILVPILESVCIVLSCSVAWQLGCRAAAAQGVRYTKLIGAAAALITFCALLQTGVAQMEAPLAIGLFLLGILLFDVGSQSWLAVLVLATTVRYEFYLLLPVVGVVALLQRKLTWKAIAYASITLALSIGWLLFQYGTIIPNTVKAKAIGYDLPFTETMYMVGLGRGVIVALLLVVAWMIVNRKRLPVSAVLLFTFGILLCAAYVSRRTFVFSWYQPLTRVPLMLGLLLGPALAARSWIKLLPVSLVLFLFLRNVKAPDEEVLTALTNQPWRDHVDNFNLRVFDYLATGKAMNTVCPQAKLLTSEIGALGYAFPGEVLDGFGLATPAALKWHPMKVPEQRANGGLGAIPAGFFAETHPDVVVTFPVFSEDLMRHYNSSEYELVTFPALREVGAELHPGPKVAVDEATLTVLIAKTGACSVDKLKPALNASLRASDESIWGRLPASQIQH
jgi:hypothetical protein